MEKVKNEQKAEAVKPKKMSKAMIREEIKKVEETRAKIIDFNKGKEIVEGRVDYYTKLLKAKVDLYKALQAKIKEKTGGNLETARLTLEAIELSAEIENEKKMFENYMRRKNEHETYYDEVMRECNQQFDTTMAEAKEIVYNLRLQQGIKDWEALEEKGENTPQMKVEFYTLLRSEVINKYKYGKKKR